MSLIPVFSGIIGLTLCVLMIFFVLKGASTPKEQRCLRDQWTTVIRNFGTGYPKDFRLEIVTENGSVPEGEFCEQKYLWIFPKTPKLGKLQSNLSFHRDWINARYVVSIKPTEDAIVKVY